MKSFHISRWRYALGYVIVIGLAIGAMWLYDAGRNLLGIVSGILAAGVLIVFEILVRKKRIYLNNEIKIVEGKKIVKTSYDVDVSVNQSVLGQILGFGDVTIKTADEVIVLKYIEWPNKIKRLIER